MMMTFLSLSLERHLRRPRKRKRSPHDFATCLLLLNHAIRRDLLRTLTYLICACGTGYVMIENLVGRAGGILHEVCLFF
ncbi:Basic transcription factor 3, partial [Zea mays]